MRRAPRQVPIVAANSKAIQSDDIDALFAREFPVQTRLIYLNHAAVAPWPQRTADAVAQFAAESAREGAHNYLRWVERESRLRDQIARLINAPSSDDIALLKNTSEALSVVAHGFPWKAGDSVVICREEFPSNRVVWESLERYGVDTRQVSLIGCADPERALTDAADSSTRLISVSSVQYARGLRLDLTRLGQLCHQRGIALCVDAIQGLGALPHDVQAMHIDFLMADAHKWLLGPEGIAAFYCRGDWRERLTLHQYGWHMVENSGDYERRDWEIARSARRFECGSPNMLGIYALSESLSLLEEIGAAEIEERITTRARHLFESIQSRSRLELVTDTRSGRYSGIVTFRHNRADHEALFRHLRLQGVVCAPRGGGIRFSPHCYVPFDHLDRAMAAVDSFTG